MKDLHKNKTALSRICQLGATSGAVIGSGWLAVFVATQHWMMAISMALLGLAVLPCWMVARRGNLSLGLMSAQVLCILFTVLFSLALDSPNESVPRTTHLFLLVIALVGYVNFQREPSRMQLGLIAGALLLFLLFSSITFTIETDTHPSAGFHAARAWANATLVTLLLCGGIAAMHAEFSDIARRSIELRDALENNQFELFYQPQNDVNGRPVGAEALLRWRHPRRGYVSPAEFIPLAESNGSMPVIGAWVIREACKTLARWQHSPSTRNLSLSINITSEQFAQSNFVDELIEITSAYSIKTSWLKLELTESAFLADIDSVIEKMQALRSQGFTISLDDFGTGYSSLSYLRRLPLTQLKIDRSFVREVDKSSRTSAIVRSIVQMGHDLSLEVLAEGVETESQLRVMQSYGCKVFQGFLFAMPMPGKEFDGYMESMSTAERGVDP